MLINSLMITDWSFYLWPSILFIVGAVLIWIGIRGFTPTSDSSIVAPKADPASWCWFQIGLGAFISLSVLCLILVGVFVW